MPMRPSVTDRGVLNKTHVMYAADPGGKNYLTEADVYPDETGKHLRVEIQVEIED